MKKYIFLLLLSFVVLNASAFELVELKLPNSNKIVVKFMFKNGSISDIEGKKGITRLTASLMTEGGTNEYSSTKIKEITYPWAAEWYATVDKEVTIFTFQFHKDHINNFMPIMLGLITQPSMSEEDFNRLKSNQLNYVTEVIKASSDEEYSKMGLENMLFRDTNYQHMVNGTASNVESISLEDVINHYRNVFANDNLTIGIAGNYDQSFITALREGTDKLPAVAQNIPFPGKPHQPDGINVEIISKKNALGSAIFTGYPLEITRANDDFAALMVANSWLGEHRKSYSQLYKKIRQERSMNYGDYSYIEWYNNGGSNMLPPPGYPRSSNYFAIWIRPVQIAEGLKTQYPELKDITTGHAHFALKMALNELNKLYESGLSEEDFTLTRDFLRSYMKLYVQTPERQLGYLLDSRFYNRKNYIEEMDQLLAKLTVEQVNNAIKKYFNPRAMDICIVTDDSEVESLKKVLSEGSFAAMSYSDALKQTLPEEILIEDEQVGGTELKVNQITVMQDEEMFKD